ncbi:MAG: hypothetical protein WC199_10355, partial [Dysgonamonadaceae bacterium]
GEDGTKVMMKTLDMQNIVPENSRLVSTMLRFRATRVKYMTGILGKKILELYGSDNEDARYDLSIEIVVILDKIADLVAKNIDDVSQLENVAMKQTIVNTIRDAGSKSDDVRDDLRYFT